MVLVSCETDNRFEENNYTGSEPLTYFTGLPEASDNDILSVNIDDLDENEVILEVGSTSKTSSDRTYTVTPIPETADLSGINYTLTSNSVTIPAGEYVGTTSVEIITENYPADVESLDLKFDLDGPDVAEFQNQITLSVVVIIPVPDDRYVSSDWNVSSVVCTGDGNGNCDATGINFTSQVTMSPGEEAKEFILSDITGGLYAQGYGESDQPGTIFEINGQLFLEDQPDTVFGSDVFNGTGSIILDDDGKLIEFTIDWSNDYGDAGTNTYTLIE